MAISTDRGKTYRTLDSLTFCNKCGTKTLLCPHRILSKEDLELPDNTTHIRFAHPILRLRSRLKTSSHEDHEKRRRQWLEEILCTNKNENQCAAEQQNDGGDDASSDDESDSSDDDDEVSSSGLEPFSSL